MIVKGVPHDQLTEIVTTITPEVIHAHSRHGPREHGTIVIRVPGLDEA